MATKMAVAFANIFTAKIEKEILRQSYTKPIVWKRYIDDITSMWNTSRDRLEDFLLKANSFHPTIKFTESWESCYFHPLALKHRVVLTCHTVFPVQAVVCVYLCPDVLVVM